MKYFSFHTHSSFCDGKASIEEVCQTAVGQGLSSVGFSSHAPVPFKTHWAMSFEDLSAYRNEIRRCRELYGRHINIYAALEADYIPGYTIPFGVWKDNLQLDYLIGSVHMVVNPQKPGEFWFLDGPEENYLEGLDRCFGGDIEAAVGRYYLQIQEMVKKDKPDIVAHMDKVVMNNKGRFFSGDESWYLEAVEDALSAIQESGSIVEVNTRGIYRRKHHSFFPNEAVIRRCIEKDIPLTVSVDAHRPSELKSEFLNGVRAISDQGGKTVAYFNGSVWEQIGIDSVV